MKLPTKCILFALALLASPLQVGHVEAQALTEEQGTAILEELRQIRGVLQRIERRLATPTQPQARRQARPTRVSVSTKDRPILGKPDAPITLVEFTDYQCPFCNRFFQTTLPELKKRYIDTGKLRLVIKDLPLPFHRHARKAAQAAHCAGDQGRFWEMHDVIFENAPRIEPPRLIGYADKLSLDMLEFGRCFESDRHLAQIDKDTADARAANITGTPSFILGKTSSDVVEGRLIVGAQPFPAFDNRIKALLRDIEARKEF